MRVIVACGPFYVPPQNSDSKKLLNKMIREVSLRVPDFLIISGPLILEKEVKLTKDEYLRK
jgi:hypothetical protein